MKSRSGFVSNSSTSSFILKCDPFLYDCLSINNSESIPTVYDVAMGIASSESFHNMNQDELYFLAKRLAEFSNQRINIKYISLQLWRGAEVFQLSNDNIYAEYDNCIEYNDSAIANCHFSEKKFVDDFSEDIGEISEEAKELDSIYQDWPNPEKLFSEDDHRHISAIKASKVLGPALVISENKNILIVNGKFDISSYVGGKKDEG